jgi:hypothetical protein
LHFSDFLKLSRFSCVSHPFALFAFSDASTLSDNNFLALDAEA